MNILRRLSEYRAELRAAKERARHRTLHRGYDRYEPYKRHGWFHTMPGFVHATDEWRYGPPQQEMRGIIGGVTRREGRWEAWLDVGFLPKVYRGFSRDMAMYRVEEGFKHYAGGEFEVLGPDPRTVAAQHEGMASMKRLYDMMGP
jgi:hypothetical protein